MNTQPNLHHVKESLAAPFAEPILPAVIEQTARRVFESFTEKMKATLGNRQERGLKLALEGHVTHKFERTFNVISEDGQHSYLVNLASSFCTCPDSQKGYVCKHRLAAYLVEQSMKASLEVSGEAVPLKAALSEPSPSDPDEPQQITPPLDPQDETIEKVRLSLHARSEYVRESIVYAILQVDKERIPVEIIELEGDTAFVRALPYDMHGQPVPRFPFPERKSFTHVIAKSLVEVKIYR
jgi:hypothetical protein